MLYPLKVFGGSLLPFEKAIGIVVDRLAAPESSAADDPARHFLRASMDVSKVLLRLYDKAEDRRLCQLRDRCLGFWDVLLRADFVNQHSLLERIDSG
jgi:hypothetical protein